MFKFPILEQLKKIIFSNFNFKISVRPGETVNSRPAFTLLETIVSVAIITSITALFIANYRSSSPRSDIIMRAQSIVSDIHAAQNNALGLVKYNNLVPAGGWGVSFNKTNNSYTLFADLDGPDTPGYLQYDPDSEGDARYGARTVTFPANIEILEIKASNNSIYNLANVTFLPPDPKTNIWLLGGATSSALEIKIRETVNNSTKTVRVNFLGLAEVIE